LNRSCKINYYEGRYERNGDGALIDIAVWLNFVIVFSVKNEEKITFVLVCENDKNLIRTVALKLHNFANYKSPI